MARYLGSNILCCIIAFSEIIDTEARSVRRKRQFYSPISLPGGFTPFNVPIGYNPTLFSNPDTHGFDMGTEYNSGTTFNFEGDLHFPVVMRALGAWLPWDLHGDLVSGTDNVIVDYGHLVKGVNPLKLPLRETYPCLLGLCSNAGSTSPSGSSVGPFFMTPEKNTVPRIGLPLLPLPEKKRKRFSGTTTSEEDSESLTDQKTDLQNEQQIEQKPLIVPDSEHAPILGTFAEPEAQSSVIFLGKPVAYKPKLVFLTS